MSETLRDRIEAIVAEYSDDEAASWRDGVPSLNRTTVVRDLRVALADTAAPSDGGLRGAAEAPAIRCRAFGNVHVNGKPCSDCLVYGYAATPSPVPAPADLRLDAAMVERAMQGGYVAELPAETIAERLRAALTGEAR